MIIFSNEDINCLEMRKTKDYLISIRNKLKNELCFKLFYRKDIDNKNKFIEDLHKYNLFNDILNAVCSDQRNFFLFEISNYI